jgi:hypothetical protein
MKVIVKHMNFETNKFDAVAEVDVTELYSLSRMDHLEYAFRWTNNIDGSWSRKLGGDANEAVTVLMTREDGRGLRSTSMFDRMEIDGVEYEVGMCGFEKIAA